MTPGLVLATAMTGPLGPRSLSLRQDHFAQEMVVELEHIAGETGAFAKQPGFQKGIQVSVQPGAQVGRALPDGV